MIICAVTETVYFDPRERGISGAIGASRRDDWLRDIAGGAHTTLNRDYYTSAQEYKQCVGRTIIDTNDSGTCSRSVSRIQMRAKNGTSRFTKELGPYARSWTTKMLGALYPRRSTLYLSLFMRPSKYTFSRSQSMRNRLEIIHLLERKIAYQFA